MKLKTADHTKTNRNHAFLRNDDMDVSGRGTLVSVDFSSRLSAQLSAIDNPGSRNRMNFNIPGEVAGNLAGGIGKNQRGNRDCADLSVRSDGYFRG